MPVETEQKEAKKGAKTEGAEEQRLDRSLLFDANESAFFFAILAGLLW